LTAIVAWIFFAVVAAVAQPELADLLGDEDIALGFSLLGSTILAILLGLLQGRLALRKFKQ